MFNGWSIALDFDVDTPFKQKQILKKKVLEHGGCASPIVGKKVSRRQDE